MTSHSISEYAFVLRHHPPPRKGCIPREVHGNQRDDSADWLRISLQLKKRGLTVQGLGLVGSWAWPLTDVHKLPVSERLPSISEAVMEVAHLFCL